MRDTGCAHDYEGVEDGMVEYWNDGAVGSDTGCSMLVVPMLFGVRLEWDGMLE